jgi:CBS domain containing-hemolysin-like protein
MTICFPVLAAALSLAVDGNWAVAFWLAVAIVSLFVGAVFSGNEIGIFSLSRVRLRLRTARREPNALVLEEWLKNPTYALQGLLVLQNVAGFAFSAAVTGVLSALAVEEFGQGLISILVVTPVTIVFADILPKDLFHTHADRWTYRSVPWLRAVFKLITAVPLLPLVNLLSWLSMKLVGGKKTADTLPQGPRMEMLSLFQESVETGALTGTQQDLVQRALRLARINIREVMMPWNNVVGVPATISRDGFRALVRRYNVSRMPVLGRSPSEVLGIVDVIDVLTVLAGTSGARSRAAAAGVNGTAFKLVEHVHPAMTLIGEQSVRSAITLMQKARQTLAVVVDRQGRAIGLVTMKDLVEELVGDLENW